jgi:type IX secretion system substrate protein
LQESKKGIIIGRLNVNLFLLKRLLPIISFILFLTINSQGQSRVPQDGGEHIIKFYPNPAISFITFDLQKTSDKGYDMQIFNFLGKMVFEQKNIATKTTINLNEYSRGVYIYQLRDHDGKILDSGKFQVSK